MKKYLTIIILILIFLSGIYLGYLVFGKSSSQPKISSEILLTALQNEGFLITQTYIFNENIAIEKGTGSFWKDIFWGQELIASGTMKVSSGVDLTKLSTNDVKIKKNEIEVDLPEIEQHSVELLSEIILKNKQGILKRIFDNDDGYNEAFNQLKIKAKEAAQDKELLEQAQLSTSDEIKRLIRFIDKDKEVVIKYN